MRKDGSDLVAGEHDRQAMWTLGARHLVDGAEVPAKDALVEKHEGIQGLVLRRGADVLFHREVAQERPNLFGSHLLRVADSVVKNESPDPVNVCLLGARAVVERANHLPHPIQQPRSGARVRRNAWGCGTDRTLAHRRSVVARMIGHRVSPCSTKACPPCWTG